VSPAQLVERAVGELLIQAVAEGVGQDAIARALIDRALVIYRTTRAPEDIAAELTFIADHLDDDERFAFMRP